jgi:predicted N-acetyltransferase YhbS
MCTTSQATRHTGAVTEDAARTVSVVELAHLEPCRADEVIGCLAHWHTQEWGHLYRSEVWNLEAAREEFAEHIARGGGSVPTTYVALTVSGDVVGSVSLVDSDDLEGFDHIGPWLASLYVDTPWRHRGIARLLIGHLLTQPPARQADSVYLFTPEHAAWYAGLGWKHLATSTTGPQSHQVSVMVRRAGEV